MLEGHGWAAPEPLPVGAPPAHKEVALSAGSLVEKHASCTTRPASIG